MSNFTLLFQLLLNGVIPVGIICFLGYFFGCKKVFDRDQANTILKFVATIGVPAISADIVSTVEFQQLDLYLCGLYTISELITYFFGFSVARFFFRVQIPEAILVGAAASFANHVLFVYPIALLEFDKAQVTPITSIILVDVIVLSVTVFFLDWTSSNKTGVLRLIFKQSKNPALLGLLLGAFILLAPFGMPIGVERTFEFIANSAAPCALFALGLLLSYENKSEQFRLAIFISLLKVVVHPFLAGMFIFFLASYSIKDAQTTMMVSVAPVGLMALTFAPKYNVRTDAIALSIMLTFLISLFLVPFFGVIDSLV